MRRLRSFVLRIGSIFRKSRMRQEFEAELDSHVELATQENLRAGMSPEEARRRALVTLGGVEQTKEAMLGQATLPFAESLFQDAKFAVRLLRKSPGFAFAAIGTLALGIGANTAIFSIVNTVLLRPLPYHAAQELVWVADYLPRQQNRVVLESDYYAWQAQNRAFTGIAAYESGDTATLTGAGEAQRLRAQLATYTFLSVLGVQPTIGRNFSEEEDRPGAQRVAILSDALFRTRFGGNPAIVGQSMELDGDPYTIIGVLPAKFEFLDSTSADVLLPYALENHEMTMQKGMRIVNVVGRLRRGVSAGLAVADLEGINERLYRSYPGRFANMFRGYRAEVVPLGEHLHGKTRPMLLVLLGAVGFVLLIACANIAGLQLARGASRGKELAIRGALGAGKGRVLRQLLTESALLAAVGGISGLLFSVWLIRALVGISPEDVPHLSLAGLNPQVLLFSVGVTGLAGMLFGVVPAIAAVRPQLVESLKESGSHPGGTRVRNRLQKMLVVAQLAAALVLLTGSALLLKSLYRLSSVSLGFDAERVFTAKISLPPNLYVSDRQQGAFFRELVDRCGALPGVTSAAAASILPLQGSGDSTSVELEGQPSPPPGLAPATQIVRVSNGYFRTLRIALQAGEVFDVHNRENRGNLLVVNQTFAKQFFPDQDPVGRRVRIGREEWWTIAGVVGDTKQFGLAEPVKATAFISMEKESGPEMTLALRSSEPPEALLPAVRTVVGMMDKNLPLYDVLTMQDLLRQQTASQRFSTAVLSSFAFLAILLACVGIYGVTAYMVSQRTREFGLRMALGAQPEAIFGIVLRQAAILIVFGMIIGVSCSLAMRKVITSMLFEVQAYDRETYVFVAVLLIAVVLGACYWPARRASRVEPMAALRHE